MALGEVNVTWMEAFWPVVKGQAGSASEQPAMWICTFFAVVPIYSRMVRGSCSNADEMLSLPQSWNLTALTTLTTLTARRKDESENFMVDIHFLLFWVV
jgi:hypothetical protein